MKPIIVLFTIVPFMLLSCNKMSVLPGISMGMPEDEWKSYEYSLKKPDSVAYYDWKFAGTVFQVRIVLNGDGIKADSLRIASLYLGSINGIDTAAQADALKSAGLDSENLFTKSTFKKQDLEAILAAFTKKFGKQDSLNFDTRPTWRIGEDPFQSTSRDTSMWVYHFSSPEECILVRHNRLSPANKFIPFDHFDICEVHLMPRDYRQILQRVMSSRSKNLSAVELLEIPVSVSYGTPNDGMPSKLTVIAAVDDPNTVLKSIEVQNAIKAVKGRVVVTDQFDDSLLSYSDFEMNFSPPLAHLYPPGLDYLLTERPTTLVFNQVTKGFTVNLSHPDIPAALRAAAKDHRVRAKFIPEAVKYTDGSIIR